MSFFERIKYYWKNPRQSYLFLTTRGVFNYMPDILYIKMIYWLNIGQKLNLEFPCTFSEKLQWLKLYDRNPRYTEMVDKYAVKKYVAKYIGEKYVIPLLGVWDHFNDIDFTALPNSFVLKCTHDSGGVIVVKDKSKLNIKAIRKIINGSMSRNYFWMSREWPYKNVKPRIIAEQYMNDGMKTDLVDYKFFCMNGFPQFCQVICNRSVNESIDFFDMDWIHQEFTGLESPYKQPYKNSCTSIPVPANFEKMKDISKKLSEGIPFVRVDFYEISGHLYFGELTFFPLGGLGVFSPNIWNIKIGEMLDIEHIDCK